MTAPEAAAAWQLLEEMADTLCPKDPRGKQDRLCDAFMARMHGEPRLTCLCQREDCPKKDAALPDRRVPLTMITVDIATLIGLLANPAYLAGHGSIDPDLARELARNSQWQVLLTDAVTLAEKLGLAVQNPETGEWERRSGGEKAGTATGSDAGTVTDTDTDADADAGRDAAVDADANSAADAHAAACRDEATGSAAAEDRSSTGPTSATAAESVPGSKNTSAPEPADDVAETEGPDENGETAGSEQNDQSSPVPTADPSTTPDPDPAEPHRKHAATGAPAAVTDPLAEATSDTGPDAAASSEPVSDKRSPAQPASPAPDVAPSRSESRSSAAPSGSTTSSPTSAEGPAPGTGSTAAAASDNRDQRRPPSLTSAASLFCTHTPVGRGTRHSSALDLGSSIRPSRTMHTPGGIYLGNASLAAALEAAIAADPTLGRSVGRDPLTDRALIYRPDTLTTAAVRLRDRHCRFPGCHRPADRCQLDHVTAFDHANPLGGGWTTINNLQCLCEFHHTVKTAGYWTAVMLPGGAILWRSTSKTTRITLPANGTVVPILDNDLRPHIPTKPRRSGIIAYPDPPNPPGNEQSETDDTAAPPF
ncbi:hypothetical protein [Rhodococcus sp. Leaf278]|uniref:hypothetical protein n=1 Tax=Rhodococcus sp. Leaf278 TaxID=1736319 RepID=UPI001F37CA0C|nr:hypothetical protein [Rhodococcus sp. Leaf278]